MKNIKLKVGVIGLGVGYYHLKCFMQNKFCKVVSVCDFDKKKIDTIKKKFPKLKTTLNDKDIINNKEIDLVCIASYDNYHCNQILESVKNKKHVFVEKPICTNYKEYIKIKNIFKKYPKSKISSNFILRTSPQFIQLNNLVKMKKFGKIFYISGEYNYGRLEKIITGWRGKLKKYSVTHGGAIHIIDLALSIIKKKPDKVSAGGNKISTERTKFKSNDITTSLIKFNDGTILNVTSNFGCVMPHHHSFKLYGTKGTFVQEYNKVNIYSSRDKNTRSVKMKNNYSSKNKKKVLENFIESLTHKNKPLVDKQDVFNSMAVSIAIDKSVKSNKWEKIKY